MVRSREQQGEESERAERGTDFHCAVIHYSWAALWLHNRVLLNLEEDFLSFILSPTSLFSFYRKYNIDPDWKKLPSGWSSHGLIASLPAPPNHFFILWLICDPVLFEKRGAWRCTQVCIIHQFDAHNWHQKHWWTSILSRLNNQLKFGHLRIIHYACLTDQQQQ